MTEPGLTFFLKPLFAAAAKPLVEGPIKGLGSELKNRWAMFKWEDAAKKYEEHMLHMYGKMRIFGMPEPVALSEIFTHVKVLDKPTIFSNNPVEQLERIFLEKASFGTVRETLPGLDVVDKNDKLFILGKPGAGKTTFMKHLVLQALKGRLKKVPMFVGLKEWSDSNLSLKDFLVKQFEICGFPDAWLFIEHTLDCGQGLVLFDGLDEVSATGDEKDRVIGEIRDLSNRFYKSSMVITCRIASNEYEFEHFSYVEMADFTDEQVMLFVEKWFKDDENDLKSFKEEFSKEESKSFRELAYSPLLLTLICINYEERGSSFPVRKCDLYDKAMRAVLERWDSSRRIKRSKAYKAISVERRIQLLSYIAYYFFEKSEYLIKESDLIERIREFLEKLPSRELPETWEAKGLLNTMIEQHGIIVQRSSNGLYSFSHLTFQEFFSAKYVSGSRLQYFLEQKSIDLFDSKRAEFFLMLIELLDDSTKFILKIISVLVLNFNDDLPRSRYSKPKYRLKKLKKKRFVKNFELLSKDPESIVDEYIFLLSKIEKIMSIESVMGVSEVIYILASFLIKGVFDREKVTKALDEAARVFSEDADLDG